MKNCCWHKKEKEEIMEEKKKSKEMTDWEKDY